MKWRNTSPNENRSIRPDKEPSVADKKDQPREPILTASDIKGMAFMACQEVADHLAHMPLADVNFDACLWNLAHATHRLQQLRVARGDPIESAAKKAAEKVLAAEGRAN